MDGVGKATIEALEAKLSANSDGVLERIAVDHGVSVAVVVRALPPEHRTLIPGSRFLDIMAELRTWGDVLVIVHTADIVLEGKGAIPPGTIGRGYYNLHGESPIGGHIRYENCAEIAFVSRPFMGRHSCSVQFFNTTGDAMFKVFVRRDAARKLVPEQVARFEGARRRFSQTLPSDSANNPPLPDQPVTSSSATPVPPQSTQGMRAMPIIGAKDLNAAKAYYTQQLGFSETVYEDDGYMILRRGTLELHFWPTEDKGYLEKTAVYIRADEIEALHAEYKERGVAGLSRLEVKPWGMREFNIIDPSGILLRFGAAPQGDA